MRWALITGILLTLAGTIGLLVVNYYAFIPDSRDVRVPLRGPGTPAPAGGFASNGEQIFFTGTSARDPIATTGGPTWFRMHGGGCATCHGPDGRGGTVVMMGSFTAPDITYKTLTGDAPEMDDHRPYTDELIKRAITRGLDPEGRRLNLNMPRWQMSDRDLDDVIEYLRILDP